MSWILNIDTAVEGASISLCYQDKLLASKHNAATRDSASWLHPAMQELLQETNITFSQISAIAVSAGPGSYTGLRVGMAAAKGLCFALKIPLLSINTLKIMASAAVGNDYDLYVPMIDARRMEVFTAVFDRDLNEIIPSKNLILTEESFAEILNEKNVLFFGNGSKKFESICKHSHAFFKDVTSNADDMITLAWEQFCKNEIADLAYSEPHYGKDFYSPQTKHNG